MKTHNQLISPPKTISGIRKDAKKRTQYDVERGYRRFADIGQDVVVELRRDADDLLPPVLVVLGDHHGRRGDGGETPDGSRRRRNEVQRCEPPLGGAAAKGGEREEGEKGRRREQRTAETQERWEGACRHGIAN